MLTDNEIIKALECCKETVDDIDNESKCCSCSLIQDGWCTSTLAKNALSLINRQKAEIERFRKNDSESFAKWNKLAERTINHYEELFQVAKVAVREKAIKEFAERLKKVLLYEPFLEPDVVFLGKNEIDNLVKEMVGEDNG